MVGRILLTSDTHFDHDLVAGLRGFASPGDHDAHVADTWNSIVTDRDTVWHLGDVGMGRLRRWRDTVENLNGTIHLVTGNHDTVAPGVSRRAHRDQREWMEVFASIQPFARLRRGDAHLLLSHYPYSGEGMRDLPERFTQYRLRNEGLPLAHGHTHSGERLTSDEGTPMIHVGWDAWGGPVDLDAVWDLAFQPGR